MSIAFTVNNEEDEYPVSPTHHDNARRDLVQQKESGII